MRPSVRVLGAEFGRRELRDVLLSSLALTAIFAAGFAGGLRLGNEFFPVAQALLPAAFIASVPASFVALGMQKRVGTRSGCTIEFRLDGRWTLLSLLLAVSVGFALGLTGKLHRFGSLTRSGAGRMAAAGPLAFLAISATSLIASVAAADVVGPYAVFTLRAVTQVDAWLALLSLFPVPFFAGADVFRWSKPFWALLGAVAGLLFFAPSLIA